MRRTLHRGNLVRSLLVSLSVVVHQAACAPMLAVDAASTATTGKGTTEHALDEMTGKDCRIIEGVARSDRRLCEPRGTPATDRDFKGLSRQ